MMIYLCSFLVVRLPLIAPTPSVMQLTISHQQQSFHHVNHLIANFLQLFCAAKHDRLILVGIANIAGLNIQFKKNAVYCYACRLFGSSSIGSSRPEKAFTTTGFHDWKHATGSSIAWEQFRGTSLTGSVDEQLGNNRSEMVKMNRHYIRTVAEILLCSQQDISWRGHDESNKSLNKGNLKEFLSVVANHDTVVAKKLQQKCCIHVSQNTE